jgi:predicted amino acid racemase
LNATSIGVVSSDPILLNTLIEMQSPKAKLSKGEIVTVNSRNMATMGSQFFSTSYVYDAFLLRKMDLNCGTKNKIKLTN